MSAWKKHWCDKMTNLQRKMYLTHTFFDDFFWGVIEMFWHHFWGAGMTSVFI